MSRGFTDEVTGERLRGITYLLERCFWPTYSYRKATSGAVKCTAAPNAPKGKRGGLIRGSQVDSQICGCVNRGVAPTHPYAIKILKALSVSGLKPEKAQVRVTDPTFGIGTGVDLLCSRTSESGRKKLVICEIKAGFNRPGVYEMACGTMIKCLKGMPNSLRNQHQVQTVVTRALFMSTFPEHEDVDACIVRVSDEGVHIHPVDRKLYQKAGAIMETISLARNRIKVKKPFSVKKKKYKRLIETK